MPKFGRMEQIKITEHGEHRAQGTERRAQSTDHDHDVDEVDILPADHKHAAAG